MAEPGPPGVGTASWSDVRAMSWHRTPVRRRATLLIAAALLAAAVVLAAAAANTAPRRTVRVAHPTAPPVATLDAIGCPVHTRCLVTAAATPELTEALVRRFPAAALLSRSRTVDAGNGEPYRSAVVASLADGSVLDVAAECDPGAPQRPGYQMSNAVSHLDLAGNEVVDERTVTTVVPGQAGCTVSVQLRSTTDSPQVLAAAVQLAHDMTVQLRR